MKRNRAAFAAAFLLPAALAAAVPSVSLAADNTVLYDGGNQLKETDQTLAIPVVPGSFETTEIDLKNSTGSSTNWYMSNEVLESMEDAGRNAAGAAYTYALSYRAPDGEKTVIYDSSQVGGADSEGLLEVNESLGNGGYFFLGTIGKEETGTVFLTIGLNGESAVNNYQTMKGSLQTAFAVEVVSEGGPGGGNTVIEKKEVRELTELTDGTAVPGGNLGEGGVARTPGRPKTGDENRILFYVVLALAAGAGCMAMGIGIFRRDREEGERGDGKA